MANDEKSAARAKAGDAEPEAPKVRRRGRPLSPLAGAVARAAGPALAKRGLAGGRILAEWSQIVGPGFAEVAMPEGLAATRAGAGTLSLRVAEGAALEIQHLMPQIVERVNGYFGYRAVERVKILQAPLPASSRPRTRRPRPIGPAQEAAVQTDVAAVEDPELREVLARLGRSIIGSGE